jgi:microcystin-dependent protein
VAELIEVPIGGVITWVGSEHNLPPNFRLCNGDDLVSKDYPALNNLIAGVWGSKKPNTFKLPDFRGLFLRGVAGTSGLDPDADKRQPQGAGKAAEVGSVQGDQFQTHYHEIKLNTNDGWPTSGDNPTPVVTSQVPLGDPWRQTDTPASGNFGEETRPKNAYVHWIIRVL